MTLTPTIERIHGRIKITQLATNKLGDCLVPSLENQRDHTYEYTMQSGTANPLELLHLCRDGGVAL